MNEFRCEQCGTIERINDDETPSKDDDGDAICDECYHDNYEFACCVCQEYGHVDDQHNMIAVFDPEIFGEDDAKYGWRRGVYMVISSPYYTSAMIGHGWLHTWALDWIGEIPRDKGEFESPQGYPCGHLCDECQRKLLGLPAYQYQPAIAS